MILKRNTTQLPQTAGKAVCVCVYVSCFLKIMHISRNECANQRQNERDSNGLNKVASSTHLFTQNKPKNLTYSSGTNVLHFCVVQHTHRVGAHQIFRIMPKLVVLPANIIIARFWYCCDCHSSSRMVSL